MGARSTALAGDPETKLPEWQITVAYDDHSARDRAMNLVHSLQNRFKGELILSCTWWKFRYLLDPEIAMVARHYLVAAQIIVFATDAPGLFSLPVMNWIESWAAARNRTAGVLVPLMGSANIPSQLYSTKHFYLRNVAERAGLDYLHQRMPIEECDRLGESQSLPRELGAFRTDPSPTSHK